MRSPCLNLLDLPLKTWWSPLLRIAERRKEEQDSNSALFKLLSNASLNLNFVCWHSRASTGLIYTWRPKWMRKERVGATSVALWEAKASPTLGFNMSNYLCRFV